MNVLFLNLCFKCLMKSEIDRKELVFNPKKGRAQKDKNAYKTKTLNIIIKTKYIVFCILHRCLFFHMRKFGDKFIFFVLYLHINITKRAFFLPFSKCYNKSFSYNI